MPSLEADWINAKPMTPYRIRKKISLENSSTPYRDMLLWGYYPQSSAVELTSRFGAHALIDLTYSKSISRDFYFSSDVMYE